MNKQMETPIALNIGLVGQPNTGKSTLFNLLTGSRQHVGNWPGKTIERKQGELTFQNKLYSLVDLPGTYSISAYSAEELITRNQIVSPDTEALLVLVDASQLQRSMYLLAEIIDLNIPVVVACAMMDVAKKQGKTLDVIKMQKRLGVPVVAINAVKGEGIEDLLNQMTGLTQRPNVISPDSLSRHIELNVGKSYKNLLGFLPEQGINRYGKHWLATRLVEGDSQIIELVKKEIDISAWISIEDILDSLDDGALAIANARFAWIDESLENVVTGKRREWEFSLKGFDRVATHWLFGKLLAILMILLGFAASFLLLSPVMLLLNSAIPELTASINQTLVFASIPLWLSSLLTDAIIPGLYTTIMMVWFIVAVVFVFGVMEDIGYMARIAYVFDPLMERLGLNGKSVLPLISGFGCNIASVAGSRIMDSNSQRRITIITSMVVPCLGCWGVISLVATIFFSAKAIWVVLSLFLVTFVHIAITAWLFRDRSTNGKRSPGLLMELPPYHTPSWKSVFRVVTIKLKHTTAKAGSAIFVAILLIWALTFSSTGDISESVLYAIGKLVEPITMTIGLDWRLFLSTIVSVFSKEATLGAITIFFGLSDLGVSFGSSLISPVVGNTNDLGRIMGDSVSRASALAFIYAFYFNIPCLGTIAAIRSETHSTRFALMVATYYMTTALIIAGITYRIGLVIF